MNSPQIGPARFRIGSAPGLACRKLKIGFTAVCCIPKLYWTPKKPKFMNKIYLFVISGLRVCPAAGVSACVATTAISRLRSHSRARNPMINPRLEGTGALTGRRALWLNVRSHDYLDKTPAGRPCQDGDDENFQRTSRPAPPRPGRARHD
jgi:hypothetical protein